MGASNESATQHAKAIEEYLYGTTYRGIDRSTGKVVEGLNAVVEADEPLTVTATCSTETIAGVLLTKPCPVCNKRINPGDGMMRPRYETPVHLRCGAISDAALSGVTSGVAICALIEGSPPLNVEPRGFSNHSLGDVVIDVQAVFPDGDD